MTSLLAITPADAHALTMVGVLAFALGSLITMFFIMARNGQRNAKLDLPELPDFTQEEKPAPKKKKEQHPTADWERNPDWWK